MIQIMWFRTHCGCLESVPLRSDCRHLADDGPQLLDSGIHHCIWAWCFISHKLFLANHWAQPEYWGRSGPKKHGAPLMMTVSQGFPIGFASLSSNCILSWITSFHFFFTEIRPLLCILPAPLAFWPPFHFPS